MEALATRGKGSIITTGVPTQGSSLHGQELQCGSLVSSSSVQRTYSSSALKTRQHHIHRVESLGNLKIGQYQRLFIGTINSVPSYNKLVPGHPISSFLLYLSLFLAESRTEEHTPLCKQTRIHNHTQTRL